MSSQYRKPVTINDFTQVKLVERESHVRIDPGDMVVPAIGIFDVDKAVESFITNKVNPSFILNGELISVPVMYANPEKWNSIQTQGFYRDEKNRLMLPFIAFRRDGITHRENLRHMKVSQVDANRYYFQKQYSSRSKYDQFSRITNRVPLNEYYSIALPEFVTVNYTIIVWTHYLEQLNALISKFIHVDQQIGGDAYKFTMMFDSYDMEVINETGTDRMAKATIQLHSNAYLIPKDIGNTVNLQKLFSTGVIKFDIEAVADITKIGKMISQYSAPDVILTNYYLISEANFAMLAEDGRFTVAENFR